MSLSRVSCGPLGSVDRAAFSRCGSFLAVASAPASSLKVMNLQSRRSLSPPRVQDVDAVTVAGSGDRCHVVYHRAKSNQLERWSVQNKRLEPLELPDSYEVSALTTSADGNRIAAGNTYGQLVVYDLGGSAPHRSFSHHFQDASIYAAAFDADGSEVLVATNRGQQWRLDAVTGKKQPLHGRHGRWDCLAVAAHPEMPGAVALAGDSNRIWLLDLPFELEVEGRPAGNGYPMQDWERDMGDFAEQFSLRKRIYTPRLSPERCAWIDSEAGSIISLVQLTADWRLLVVGDSGLELWNLRPLRLAVTDNWRTVPSRRVFAGQECRGLMLLACETR